MNALRIILLALQALTSLALIILVTTQTTKNEGLTGTIGGQTSANFKGKPGYEERLQMITRNVAIAFFAISIAVGVAYRG